MFLVKAVNVYGGSISRSCFRLVVWLVSSQEQVNNSKSLLLSFSKILPFPTMLFHIPYHRITVNPFQAQHGAFSDEALVKVITVSRDSQT